MSRFNSMRDARPDPNPTMYRQSSRPFSHVHLTLACALFTLCSSPYTLAQSPSAQSFVAQGVQLLRSGEAAQAKEKFDQALKIAPGSADALTWRGVSENQMHQYAEAASDFRKALRTEPSMIAAHYNLALSLIRLHQNDAAIEQLRFVVAAQPTAVQPRYNLAVLLEAKGAFPEALEHLKAAHGLTPGDTGVILHLLLDSLKLNGHGDISSLVAALSGGATEPEAKRQAGSALLDAGRFPEAVALLRDAQNRDPSAAGEVLLARALIGSGWNADAISLLKATPPTPVGGERTYLLALAYNGMGDLQNAAENFRTAARLDPKDARPLYHLALIAAAAPQGGNEGVSLLRSAVELEPHDPIYTEALARLLLATDHPQDAKSALARLQSSGATDVQQHTLMGVALAALHDIPGAIPELEAAVHLDPALALAHNVLGFCLFQQGRYPEAAAAYGKASELEPNRLLYARDAALAYDRASNAAEALRFAKRANATGGASAPEHALLGKLYAAAGQREDAVRELRRAAELDPNLDSAFYLLARTYLQMGDRRQATEWAAKLATLKQQHQAAFDLQKKSAGALIGSSTLLVGGTLTGGEADVP